VDDDEVGAVPSWHGENMIKINGQSRGSTCVMLRPKR
jgi:hypothetical protein